MASTWPKEPSPPCLGCNKSDVNPPATPSRRNPSRAARIDRLDRSARRDFIARAWTNSHVANWLFAVCLLLSLLCAQAFGNAAFAEDWPGFLGPRRNGISRAELPPMNWDVRPPRERFRVPLGQGYSSLAVVGDRVFTLCQRDDQGLAVCLAADNGQEIWKTALAGAYLDGQNMGPGPRATPFFADGRVYCLFATGELACLSANDGSVVWNTNVFDASGASHREDDSYYWGMSASPLVVDGLVIVQPGGDRENSLVAFDALSGRLVWGVGSDGPGYGSPILIEGAGRRQVVCTTAQSVIAVEPTSGHLLWRYVWGNMYNCNCATPLFDHGLLLVSSGYDTGAVALAIEDRQGELTTREVWKHKNFQNQFATSVAIDGYLYGCHGTDGGFLLRCVDTRDGKVQWSDRRAGKFSLIAVGDRLITLSQDGDLKLFAANPKRSEYFGTAGKLLSFKAWAPPALANDRLYIRDESELVCLDLAPAPGE